MKVTLFFKNRDEDFSVLVVVLRGVIPPRVPILPSGRKERMGMARAMVHLRDVIATGMPRRLKPWERQRFRNELSGPDFFALEKKAWSGRVHTGPMKIGKDLINFQEGSPPQGLSEAGGGGSVFFLERAVIDPPRGRPFGGGGIYHNRGHGGLNPHYPVVLPIQHINDVGGCSPHRNFLVFSLVDRLKTTGRPPKCPRGN
jgi:hypothetical protein